MLERCCCPLSDSSKDEVRTIARQAGLPGAHSGESQDTCFLAGGGLHRFLGARGVDEPGEVRGPGGALIGRHKGVSYYTVGQRRGFGIASRAPLYVRRIDAERNVIELAPAEELYSSGARCARLKMRTKEPEGGITARIRHGHSPARIESVRVRGAEMIVTFRSPQRAVTPGQSLVIYRGDTVVGGGVIEEAIP